MKNSAIILSALFLTCCLSSCTNYLYEKANIEYDNLQYSNAIRDYNKVLAKKNIVGAKIKLANTYRLVNDMEASASLFADVVTYPESEPINMLHYSRALMSLNEYDNAKIWLNEYLAKVPGDEVAKTLLESCKNTSSFMRDTTLYSLNEIKLSGFESTFGQAPYRDGAIFSANKKAKTKAQKDPWSGNSFYDLYYSEKDANGHWLEPKPLAGEINGRYHEGPAVFNKAGDIAYFTRSNYIKNKLLKSSKNENNLKLFTAKLVNGEWAQLEQLPFNSDEYSVGHPALSPDEKTLYFVSDMPGGFGGTDVYKSVYSNSTWGKPENLGKEINTPGNEMFPFVSEDGKLFFSSNAHINMGGLDVFSSSLDEKNNSWSAVENLNYPINSTGDDFAFVLLNGEKSGFVSSNRNSPDKIYEFEMHDPTFTLKGKVIEKEKRTPIKNAVVTLTDKKDDTKVTVNTDKFGMYSMSLKPNSDFTVSAFKENFLTQSADISTKNKKYSEEFERNFELDSLVLEKPIVVENIYYDFDKWFIRPDAALELDKLVRTLNDNPAINIEMGSHADSRGTAKYNLALTDKRAKSAVDYLVTQGISPNRLTWKGYGESKLVNGCKDNVECTEEEHQQNRRTEFKVTRINTMSLLNKKSDN